MNFEVRSRIIGPPMLEAIETSQDPTAAALEVRGLEVVFATDAGPLKAADKVSFAVPAGRAKNCERTKN